MPTYHVKLTNREHDILVEADSDPALGTMEGSDVPYLKFTKDGKTTGSFAQQQVAAWWIDPDELSISQLRDNVIDPK